MTATIPVRPTPVVTSNPSALTRAGQLGRRLRLLERELRIAVEVDVQRFDVRIDRVDLGQRWSGPGRAAGLRRQRGGGEDDGESEAQPPVDHD